MTTAFAWRKHPFLAVFCEAECTLFLLLHYLSYPVSWFLTGAIHFVSYLIIHHKVVGKRLKAEKLRELEAGQAP